MNTIQRLFPKKVGTMYEGRLCLVVCGGRALCANKTLLPLYVCECQWKIVLGGVSQVISSYCRLLVYTSGTSTSSLWADSNSGN